MNNLEFFKTILKIFKIGCLGQGGTLGPLNHRNSYAPTWVRLGQLGSIMGHEGRPIEGVPWGTRVHRGTLLQDVLSPYFCKSSFKPRYL